MNPERSRLQPLPPGDTRIVNPLFTIAEAAHSLGVSPSTFGWWANHGSLVTRHGAPGQRRPTIPFIGVAEAMSLVAFRASGVPLQRIRPALLNLKRELGLDHALASKSLYSDGAEILYDYAERHHELDELADLVVVRSGQRVFVPVVREYVRRISWQDGWPVKIRLPRYERAEVVIDPRRAFGQPMFEHGGARIEDVVDRWRAGDHVDALARDFGVPAEEIEEVVRAG